MSRQVRCVVLVNLALVQRRQQIVLRLVAGMIEVDRDTGDGKALLAAKLDVALGTPCVDGAGKNVDVFGLRGESWRHL